MMLPPLVLHADWSTDPRKRWLSTAKLEAGVYRVHAPDAVRHAGNLVRSALDSVNEGCAVLGFDFPIGVPRAYARQAGIGGFLDVLPEFGTGRWREFYDLASRPEEISIQRPFYPARPGGTEQIHLVRGLGVTSMNDLLRRCELGTEYRNKACSLFWTLGGNQVGRAAIAGWREVLVPALRSLNGEIGIWPFHGEIGHLLSSRSCVIVETYPAEACVQLGLPAPGRGWSKRNGEHRIEQGSSLQEWANDKPIDLQELTASIGDGFGSDEVGEDRFDAVAGLLGMLGVILGVRAEGTPADGAVQTVEGWIFGQ
jgi:hypothetical protein